MIKLLSLVAFVALLGISQASYCQDNQTIGELPEGILKNVLTILITGTVNDFVGCHGNNPIDPNNVRFWYNSRSNPDVPILLDPANPTQVDPTKPTHILIHGWLCNITDDRMPGLKDAYLQRYDSNVIRVEWTTYSIALYASSFCSIPGVSQLVGAFICTLNSNHGVQINDVHVVGHSMGGQISGLTGQEVQSQCGLSLGRITGLDPAGPLYQTLPPSRRLSASDAQNVDVIHTNEGSAGFYGPCGDADFYPNCGTFQPGCLKIDNTTSPSDILDLTFAQANCNHLRSGDYMIESINPGSTNFAATSCAGCPLICIKDLIGQKHNVMGEGCSYPTPASNFVLKTNSNPPYAQG